MKTEIKENDILCFRNGLEHAYTKLDNWILTQFYDDELHSLKDEEYDIVNIKRPYYEDIMGKNKNMHYMTRTELEYELTERRLQVNNLIKEIQKKDEVIEKYNNFYNELMNQEFDGRLKNGKNRNAKKKSRRIKQCD